MTLPPLLVERIQNAKRVTVLTGAGVSAESGVPTFRDAMTGLWEKFKPEELATPRAFIRNPRLVWDWYEWRRELVRRAKPNPAHLAIAAMQDRFSRFHLITQNVDGLHQLAGSRDVLELHGNIFRTKCFAEDKIVAEWKPCENNPPKCPDCGGHLRPDVVWFEEPLPEVELKQAWRFSRECDLFLCVGTSGVVYPAAALPQAALDAGACLVVINPEPTPQSGLGSFFLQGKAAEILPALVSIRA